MGYFKPLRRKIGVLTLMLACVFAAGWARSFAVGDWITFYTRDMDFSAASYEGNVEWCSMTYSNPCASISWGSRTPSRLRRFIRLRRMFIEASLRHEGRTILKPTACVIPYWTIVIPLTLLSAWLLLSKPRQPQTSRLPLGIPDEWIL